MNSCVIMQEKLDDEKGTRTRSQRVCLHLQHGSVDMDIGMRSVVINVQAMVDNHRTNHHHVVLLCHIVVIFCNQCVVLEDE